MRNNKIVMLVMRAGSTPAAPTNNQKNKDMKTLGYCVATATLVWLAANGGEQATTTTWALALAGIIASLVLISRTPHKLSNQ